MSFKNIVVYTWDSADFDRDHLENHLKSKRFLECLPLQAKSVGWIPAGVKEDGALVYPLSGKFLVSLKTETKSVDKKEINRRLEKRLLELQSAGQEDGVETKLLSEEERESIAQSIHNELLKNAMPKQNIVNAYLDTAHRFIVVEGGHSKGKELINALANGLSGKKWAKSINKLATEVMPSMAMTNWLLEGAGPDPLDLGRDCTIVNSEDKGKIKYTNESLYDSQVRSYLNAGRKVDQLQLVYPDECALQLNAKWEIKGIKSKNYVDREKDSGKMADDRDMFSVDFLAEAEFIAGAITLLVESCGGLAKNKKGTDLSKEGNREQVDVEECVEESA